MITGQAGITLARIALSMLGLLSARALSAAAPPACSLVKSSQFAVTMLPGASPIVSGTVNGVEAHFILDTGAFYSILSEKTIEKFHLNIDAQRTAWITWIAGNERAWVTSVKDFTLEGLSGGAAVHGIQFLVSHVGLGTADGLIGQNVLGISDTEYDLANGVVRILHPQNCDKDVLAYWHGSAAVGVLETGRRSDRSPHITGSADLEGVRLRVLFDTGAARSLLSRQAAAKAGFKPDGPGVTSQGFGATGWSSVRTWIAPFKSLEVGGEHINNIKLLVGDIQDPDFDLLLGADFFLSHRVYVANGQHKLYFTYNGGAVFDLRSHEGASAAALPTPPAATELAPAPGSDDPTDAAGFRSRATASAARGDLPAAYRDFDRAIQLAPGDADTFFARALVHRHSGEGALALSDLDWTLQIRPDDVQALLLRAQLRLAAKEKNEAGAVTDLDAAIRASSDDELLPFQVAEILESHDLLDKAVTVLDQWIAAHPKSYRMAGALNNRCWVRGKMGKQLDLALRDCDAALRVTSRPAFHNSRGLVYLRLGELNRAILDYTQAVYARRDASSLYGLSLAQGRKGLAEQAERNRKAALALSSSVADEYKQMGLTP